MRKDPIKLNDISKNPGRPLAIVTPGDLMPLPAPCHDMNHPGTGPLTEGQQQRYEHSFDGVVALAIPKPQSKAEEDELVAKFLSGLKKLFSKENNWTFLQPLTLSMEYCIKCQTCNDACPIYEASGYQEIYRPTYRSEILRRIYKKYIDGENRFASWLNGNDIDLNWTTIARLAESAYRCTLCRRCAQTCPLALDNGLITHELRKIFSQEMGIAPKELHEKGTVQQLEVGSSTGWKPKALINFIEFMEEEIEEKTGRKIKIPVDKKGADILLIHNAGEFVSWPENPAAFAVIFEEAGLSWTLSSELVGYDAVNYGVWYDDIQLAKIAYSHARIAKDLRVNKIVVGECGHAHKALLVIADRVLHGEYNIPRESCLPLLEKIVFSGKLKLDPQRNNFPVTLHDPCNIVRLEGIVEPQRRILRHICPGFREMNPQGVENYCCGGGGAFAIMSSMNISDWKLGISGRMKVKQVLDTFQDVITPDIKKYVCAPCSNCKQQFRDLIGYYELEERANIHYTGLVEFIVNAMVDIPMPYLEEEYMEEEVVPGTIPA
ncbi:MAG: (Fe-S)-binding protein [Chloroflexi bacterium]|jgi:Fe-S oxidoreductase|nr:(Fe-S)-binding protein [Chloroflexota bacterium]